MGRWGDADGKLKALAQEAIAEFERETLKESDELHNSSILGILLESDRKKLISIKALRYDMGT